MKKLILILAMTLESIVSTAQIAKVALKPTENPKTPQVVLDSIAKAFPAPISQTLSTITAQNYGKQWDVEITPASEKESPLYYQVYIHNKSGRYTAIYDKNGNILRLKQILKDVSLPEPVGETLKSKYQGWSLVDKKERIINGGKSASTEYKVLLKKGFAKKAVYFDESGKVKRVLPAV